MSDDDRIKTGSLGGGTNLGAPKKPDDRIDFSTAGTSHIDAARATINWPLEMDRRNRELAVMTRERDDLLILVRNANIDAKIATQLSRSIQRNSRLMIAMEQIANKTKMDAVAAVAMRAIARDAVKGNADAQE